MNAKEYLQQVKQLNYQIQNIDDEIKQLRSEIITIRSSWPDGQPHGTGTSDPVGEVATKLADELTELEHKQLDLQSRLWRKRTEIVATIGKLQHPEHNRLLYLRYVQLEMWEQIAVEMHYTYQWVAGPLHSNALQELQQILDRS